MTLGILGFAPHRDEASARDLLSTCAIVNALIERPAAGLVAFDRDLRVEFSSPELTEILGDVERGKPLVGDAEHVAAVAGLVARVRETGEPLFEVNAGAGPRAALLASAYPISMGGEVVGVGCVLENAARDREALELLDATALAIAVFDGPQHRERLLNRPWREHVGALDDALLASLDRVYTTHQDIRFYELALRRGTPDAAADRRYTGIIAPVRSALGVVRGVMIICGESTDQTAREVAHRALRTAQDDRRGDARARDQFLATVSHELRAPITTVLLWEKVLRDCPDDAELRVRALDAIHQSAMTQARLVDDLLDISRATSGKLRVALRPLEIGPMLAAALDDEGPSATAKHQRIEHSIQAELGQVAGDLARLRQIIRNLLSNAIKFTEERGTIRVTARREARRVVIEVADSGCGIAREFLPRIFEPFSQAEDSAVRTHPGLGLGLAIGYQLVVAHGGQLSASSPGSGRGATFTLSLPVIAAREAAAHAAEPAKRLSGLRLLVVDDDRRVLDALQVLLHAAGADVDIADSAATGFGTLQRSPPDAVLSDLAMPEEDGYSFVRRIRKLAGIASQVPTLAVTGHATEADRERALAAGFDLYVTKPLDADHLISTIARLVDTKRSVVAP